MPQTTLSRECPFCHKQHSATFDTAKLNAGIEAYEKGARIQDAFPDFDVNQREFLMTGTCPACWDDLMS